MPLIINNQVTENQQLPIKSRILTHTKNKFAVLLDPLKKHTFSVIPECKAGTFSALNLVL